MFSKLSPAVTVSALLSAPGTHALSCENGVVENGVVALFNTTDKAVFTGQLLEPIQAASSQICKPSDLACLRNVTVQITKTYVGRSLLEPHLVELNSLDASSPLVELSYSVTTQLGYWGPSFKSDTPIGTNFVFEVTVPSGGPELALCGISCTEHLDAKGDCAATAELLKRFQDATEREAFLVNQRNKKEQESSSSSPSGFVSWTMMAALALFNML